jgi:hypothetical protein
MTFEDYQKANPQSSRTKSAVPNVVTPTSHFTEFRQSADWSKSLSILKRDYGDPELVRRVEAMIQNHPAVSPGFVAPAVASGAIDMNSEFIDGMIRKDAAAQAAVSSPWSKAWNGLKTTSRAAFVVAEDLYNVNPIYVGMRTGVRTYQGESPSDALNSSLRTTARTSIASMKAGVDVDWGEGFIPSQDLSPQSPEYWGMVKDMVQDGSFIGSPEEQLYKAMNAARLQDVKTTGVNTYAMTEAMWRSTHLHKTLADGTVLVRPLSYGSAIAMPFTTPGTRAYGVASATFDSAARMLLEPVDVIVDNTMMQLGKARTTLIPERALFRQGMGALQEALADMGVDLTTGNLPIMHSSTSKLDQIAGISTARIDPATGRPYTQVSMDKAIRHYESFQKIDVWDATNPYHQPYMELGYSPQEVRDIFSKYGGENAKLFNTIEHELVHTELQSKWYQRTIVDGEEVLDFSKLSDDAPEELRKAHEAAQESHDLIYKDFDSVKAKADFEFNLEEGLKAKIEAQKWADELDRSDLSGAERVNAEVQHKKFSKVRDEYLDKADVLAGDVDAYVDSVVGVDNVIDDFVEADAVTKAFENMLDDSWRAPEIMKNAKRKAGIIQTWRPYVNPKTFTEWLWTKGGQRSMQAFADTYDTIDKVLKHAPHIDLNDAARIAGSTDVAEITNIMRRNYLDAPKSAPNVGMFSDKLGRGLDAWESKTVFGQGGSLVASARRIARRAGAEGGHNIFTTTDQRENLNVISNTIRTASGSPEDIERIQRFALSPAGQTPEGVRKMRDMTFDVVVEQAEKYGKYDAAQVQHIRDQWLLAESQSRRYAVNPTTGKSRTFYHDGKGWKQIPGGEQNAMLESQFASTTAVMPNVRQIRRMTSNQRRTYEAMRRWLPESVWSGDKYLPLGLESSAWMRGADWGFGLWRDMALFRVGWAMRILPEEQLRLAGSGYSSMFSNPIDYMVFLTNNLDMVLPGDVIKLGDILVDDGLGTAMLRTRGEEGFDAAKADWIVITEAEDPRLFWAGHTRESMHVITDDIGSVVAEMGPKKAKAYFRTPEGKVIIRDVASRAKKGSGMEKLGMPQVLDDYIDTLDLKLAEMGGGHGVYKDGTDELWYNSAGVVVHRFDDKVRFPRMWGNDEGSLEKFIMDNGGEKPLSRSTRGELENLAGEAAGYNIKTLEDQKVVAYAIDDGHADLRSFFATGELDDIKITEDMPFDDARAVDPQLQAAYVERGISPTAAVPVPKGELIRPNVAGNIYDETMNTFFTLFNAVPSNKLNRSPHFQQAFGHNIALQHAFAPPEVRRRIEAYVNSNEGMAPMFATGKQKVMKEWQWVEWPEPVAFDPTVSKRYDDVNRATTASDVDPARYVQFETASDDPGFITQAFFDALDELGILRVQSGERRGMQAFGQSTLEHPELMFHGTPGYRNPYDNAWTNLERRKARIEGELLDWQDPEVALGSIDSELQTMSDDPFAFGDAGPLEARRTELNDPEYVAMKRGELEAELEGIQAEAEGLYSSQRGQEPDFENFRTGGITWDIGRGSGYHDGQGPNAHVADKRPTTVVFRVSDMPESLQKYANEYGDIEQLMDMQQHGLGGIDGLEDAWNEIALRSVQSGAFDKHMTGLMTQTAADMTNDLMDRAEVLARLDAESNGTRALLRDGETVWDSMSEHAQANSVRKALLDMDLTDAEQLLFPRYHRNSKLMEEMAIQKVRGQLWKEKAEFAHSPGSLVDELRNSYGISLSKKDAQSISDLMDKRRWRPAEILLTDGGIKPLAAFPSDQMTAMMRNGFVATSQAGLGDAAMFMDTYLTNRPLTVAETFNGWGPGKLVDDLKERQHRVFEQGEADEYFAHYESGGYESPKAFATNDIPDAGYPDQTPYNGLRMFIDEFGLGNSEAESMLFSEVHMSGGMGYGTAFDWAYWMSSPDLRNYWDNVGALLDTGAMNKTSLFNEEQLTILAREWLDVSSYHMGIDDWGDELLTGEGTILDVLGYGADETTVAEAAAMLNNIIQDDIEWLGKGTTLIRESGLGLGQGVNYGALPASRMDDGLVTELRLWRKRLNEMDQAGLDEAFPKSKYRKVDADDPAIYQDQAQVSEGWRQNLARIQARVAEYDKTTNGTSRFQMFAHPTTDLDLATVSGRLDELIDYAEEMAAFKLDVDFKGVPQEQRADSVQSIFGVENYRHDWMETGSPGVTQSDEGKWMGLNESQLSEARQTEMVFQSSKEAAMAETRDLFYDLTQKSNIADAMRLLFPFGDAWYEVLSRWANIMNPAKTGSQPYRNLRRMQVAVSTARKDGFLSTNEYGEEVFNWPGMGDLVPGLDGTPVALNTQMPVASLMFIDPSARGVAGPSMAPWVQLGARIAQPTLDNMPVLRDISNFVVYGGAEEFQPGKITGLSDVTEMFMPTPIRRMWAAAFSDDHREVYGNTKMRIFEALIASGDPRYDPLDPAKMQEAWRVANQAGTWLSLLRIVDSIIMPGQPQYQPVIERELNELAEKDHLTLSWVAMGNEYRHVQDLWGRAEADLYMIEHFGINPIVLQSMSVATVQRPATWEAVNFYAANDWALEYAPLTSGALVPKGEEVFSHREWTDQFVTPYTEGGAMIREKQNAQGIMGRIQRSAGYEMLRHQDKMYEGAVDRLRYAYGEKYASNPEYAFRKDVLDRIKNGNRAIIMAQFPPVDSKIAGDLVGERQGASGSHMYLELKELGTVGTNGNDAFRENMPAHAAVAETFARWFTNLERYSTDRDKGTGTKEWWDRSDSEEAGVLMSILTSDSEKYVNSIKDREAKEYATWIIKYIIDPLTKDEEWIAAEFAPQLESYPTLTLGAQQNGN